MRSPLIIFFLLFLHVAAIAQYSGNNGHFQVAEIKGCAPFTLNITSTAFTPYDPTWGDGLIGPTNSTSHTYANPGIYTLNMQFQFGVSDAIQITVTANTQPTFDIYTCNGQGVQVKVTDTNYDSYFINFGDGTEVAVPVGALASATHTYTTPPTTFNVNVRGKNINAADNCTPAPKSVTVVNVIAPPFIDLLTVSNSTQIDLDFTGSNNVQYRVEYARNTAAPASFQLASTINDVSSTTITNSTIRTDDNYYCTRLGAFDPCNSTTVYSNIICSANFDIAAVSNAINLSWATSVTGVSNFNIDRDGASIGTTGALNYSDNTVVCKTNYCYQLLTNYTNGSQSISLEKCADAFSTDTPTGITDVTAVVGSGSVSLNWTQDPAFQPIEYKIFRNSGSGSYNQISATNTIPFTDSNYSTDEQYCYQINYEDICDNMSAVGIEVCPIRLRGKINKDRTITLTWSDYSGWTNGVLEYIVEKYDEDGTLLNTYNVGIATTFDEIADPEYQQYRYVVLANPVSPGLGQTISNDIILIQDPIAIFPRAFTPNKDNLNDTFKVIIPENYNYVSEFEMKIFNRWGELIFSTSNRDEGWDGRFRGANQPEGSYVFTATLVDLSGRTFVREGSFVLLRK